MPFDSGLCTGRKAWHQAESSGEVECLSSGEGTAVVGQPLDGVWRLDRAEAQLHRLQHQIAYHRAADAGAGRRMPSEHLAVVSINDENDADDIAVPAGDLEDIGAPAQVRAHHHHFAVMQAALATTGCNAGGEESLFMIRKTRLWLPGSAASNRFTRAVTRR